MPRRGWRTVRMSGGDFKVLLRLADGRTCYVDVFVAFYIDGSFYQLGNRSGQLPARGGDAHLDDRPRGRRAARAGGPRGDAGVRLRARLAGAGPGVPVRRPAGGRAPARRLAARLPRRAARPGTPFFRSPDAADVPRGRSGFARWVARRMLLGDTVVELGSGTGRDAAYFARRGHPVRAYDISPDARRATQRRLRRSDDPVRGAPADAGRAAHRRAHRRRDRGRSTAAGTSTRAGWWAAWRPRPAATCGGWPGWRSPATGLPVPRVRRDPSPVCPTHGAARGAEPPRGRRRRGRRARGVRRPRRRARRGPRHRPVRPARPLDLPAAGHLPEHRSEPPWRW